MSLERAIPRRFAATAEPPWVRRTLIGIGLVFLALFVLVPLAAVASAATPSGVVRFSTLV